MDMSTVVEVLALVLLLCYNFENLMIKLEKTVKPKSLIQINVLLKMHIQKFMKI